MFNEASDAKDVLTFMAPSKSERRISYFHIQCNYWGGAYLLVQSPQGLAITLVPLICIAPRLVTETTLTVSDLAAMKERVPEVAELLRFMATPSRLLLLCQLSQGESTVSGLEATTGIRQPALSQQLADLRQRNLVLTRRESRSIIYRMADPKVAALLSAMHAIFCADTGQ